MRQMAPAATREGTAIEALANNMGTSVRMIKQHYGHVRTRDQREELTKQRSRLT